MRHAGIENLLGAGVYGFMFMLPTCLNYSGQLPIEQMLNCHWECALVNALYLLGLL